MERELDTEALVGDVRSGLLLLLLPSDIPRLTGIAVDGGVLLFTLGAALFTGLLYGVSPWDPVVLPTTALVLTVVVIAAAYLPARRAAGLDPAKVLRNE